MSKPEARKRGTLWIVLGLVALVLATYSEVGRFEFVSYDDPDYVLQNEQVRGGLSWEGVQWAFTAAHASNWHPLTWLAHMGDVEIYGLSPAGHHYSSVFLHALAAVLCFLSLRALSGRGGVALGVALLFALHPLRVESVAWVSERKDVLAGVFFFATLLAWTRYARAPSLGRYAYVLLGLVLGLLAKPMLVSLPLVLLLLDFWPLGRVEREARARCWAQLLLEKLPLLLLASASCLVTVHAQRAGGSLYTLESLPLEQRLANAPWAIARYLGHFFWPRDLAYFYPHRGMVAPDASPWTAATWLSLALVIALSAGALLSLRRWPAFFVGWFWFLVMLVPVLGIVQVGEQALADRYAYLTTVGLQLALVQGLFELSAKRPRWRPAMGMGASLLLVGAGVASARQARQWKDSETLYRHALEVTEHNYPAWTSLANVLGDREDIAGARRAYDEALAIRPSYGPALYGLGLLEQKQGQSERALELYREALRSMPGLAAAHLNLGSLLAARGERVEAAMAFERVLELFPDHPDAHYNLALLFIQGGALEDALPHLEEAVRARSDAFPAWEKLGQIHEALGHHREAIASFEQALRGPASSTAASALAWILATASEPESRDPERALELARRAAQATGRQDPRALEALAAAWARNGDFARAGQIQAEALALFPPLQQGNARARLAQYRSGEAHEHPH